MAADQMMTLRVILTEADIRKVILNTRPTTVEDLIDKLKESLGLHYNCSLQYKDPDFNYELCNLTDIADLPEKPTLKVIPILDDGTLTCSIHRRPGMFTHYLLTTMSNGGMGEVFKSTKH